MKRTMLINREDNWFIYEDTNVDPYYCAILLLQKLSKREKRGLTYNRVSAIKTLINRESYETMKALDDAVLLLLSRNLIEMIEEKNYLCTIFITDDGISALTRYREELANVYK